MTFFATTTTEGWRPGIGDPTFMGWFTVLAYFAAAYLCWRAWKANHPGFDRPSRKVAKFWLVLVILFVMLGINKQLDLQSLFTQIGRSIAKSNGWYAERQQAQTQFIVMLAGAGVLTIIALFRVMRDVLKPCGLALIGTVFIITFVIIRAASFHHMDELLGWNFLGLEMNGVFELSGIACVAIAATMNRTPIDDVQPRHVRRSRRQSAPASDSPGISHGAPSSSSQESFRWMVERLKKP